ncbi:hypothetical protein [Mycolicibacterium thermoresistibile]
MAQDEHNAQRLAPQTETQRTVGIVAAVAAIACGVWSLFTEVSLLTGITPAVIPAVFCVIATTVVWVVKARGVLVAAAIIACVISVVNLGYLYNALQDKRTEFSQIFE